MSQSLNIYLSSTLDDLEPERRAIRDALNGECVVRHSYTASEQGLVVSCLQDLERCDLFVGVLGLRYGFIPEHGFVNPDKLSITELEYRRAGAAGVPRLIFLKDEHVIPVTQTDYRTREHSPERIEAFRQMAGLEQRSARFTTLDVLREQVIKAVSLFRESRAQDGGRRPIAASGPTPLPRQSTEEIRRQYLGWLRGECERVILLGLDLRDRHNVRLGQVYVPVLTFHEMGGSATGGRPLDRRVDVETLLARVGTESVCVSGAPGAGKSTFCRWLGLVIGGGEIPTASRRLPQEFDEAFPEALRGRFPFLCPLRQWAADASWLAGNGRWGRHQLERSLATWIDTTRPGGLTWKALQEVLDTGQCVLMFDGVDEVSEKLDVHYPRSNFLTGLADAIPQWTAAGNRVLVTTRPHGVEDVIRGSLHLPHAEIVGMPRPLQDAFVQRWYMAANGESGHKKARGLLDHLNERPDLDELRPNPMLLTALCVKYDEDLRLPGDVYRLYSAVTDQVLYKRFSTEPERDLARLRLSAIALAMHQGVREPRLTTPVAEVSYEEVDDALTELTQTDRASEQASVDAAQRRDTLLSHSGLLLSRSHRRVAFYHQSFQEFLAAVRLRRVTDSVQGVLSQRMAQPEWRRTLRFLFCAIADQTSPERALIEYAPLVAELARERLERSPHPALLLADCLDVGHARGWNLAEFAEPYRQACEDALTCLLPPARSHLWQVLGDLGLDERSGVGVRSGLPDIAWMDVPGAMFQAAGEKESFLPAFRIARYPVTNAQFQCFVDDGGFQQDEWWRSLGFRRPAERPAFPHANHPREMVSWFDAMAFCAWLEKRLGGAGLLSDQANICLPTERQWERAARGEDTRRYPWGEQYAADAANIFDPHTRGSVNLHHTTPVGIYPRSISPLGIDDMAGNVWEWCIADDGPPTDDRGDQPRAQMLRGGSWSLGRDFARTTSRADGVPRDRYVDIGFRVVQTLPIKTGC